MERGKDSRIIQLLSPSMRFLLFTISGLIAQAVVVTEIEENERAQSPLSNPLRYAIALDVAPEDHTVSASEGVELTSLNPNEAASPANDSERSLEEHIALDVAAEDPSPSVYESEDMDLAEAALQGSDSERALEEAIRGFCAICQADDAHLTHPKTDTCSHKFCEECFLAYEAMGRRNGPTPTGRVLTCPLCKTPYTGDRSDRLGGLDDFRALQRRRQMEVFSVNEFLKKHKLKIIGLAACSLAFQALLWSLAAPLSDHQTWNDLSNLTSTSH